MENDMPTALRREGHRLLRVGSLLFLAGLLVGLAVPAFALPRLGLSTHLLGIMQGTFLMVIGVIWPRLKLTPLTAQGAHGLAIYGCIAAYTANFLGAIWGAGTTMLPLAAGGARGTTWQEGAIRVLLMSAALSLITAVSLVVWGLRGTDAPEGQR
jgi:hydroxylaminobenzene mutase